MILKRPSFCSLACAFIFSLGSLSNSSAAELFDPPALYLQWQRDPTTTMTVHWHTLAPTNSLIEYRANTNSPWKQATGSSVPMPDAPTGRTIHIAELTGLAPATDYIFRFGENSKEFKFRTMPLDLSKPVRFVEGGDVYHDRHWMDQMNALAGKYDPAFIVIGGDLAYANDRTNKTEKVQRWYDFFDSWKKNAITPDGRLIPQLVTPGNHEVKGFWGKPQENAACFYALYAMPGPQGYNALDFGNYLTLFLLDSGLVRPVAGEQTQWLDDWLKRREKTPHLFPVYHVPAYPSVRTDSPESENADITLDVRKYWLPVFEKHGVKLSFEHHDHAFKRTHPMRGGKIDPDGIIFLGDGAWGVKPRPTHLDASPYLAKTATVRHFYVVTLFDDRRHVLAVDAEGKIFDEVYQKVSK